MQIDIDHLERFILLASLCSNDFKAMIQNPRTPFQHRQAYKSLIDKVKRAEELSREIKKSIK